MKIDLEEYDHHLVVLLDTLNKVDLQQFVLDLKINDREIYNKLFFLFLENTRG